MADEPPRTAAVGLQIFVTFAACAAGFTAGLLLPTGIPGLLAAAFACLVLFFVARISADVEPSVTRDAVLVAGWAFTMALLLVTVGGAVRPRRVRHDVAGALGALLGIFGVLAVALLAPSAAVAAGFRRAGAGERADGVLTAPRKPAGALMPLLLGAATAGIMLVLFVLVLSIRSSAWHLTGLVAFVVLSPPAVMLLGARVYRTILARHGVETPVALREGLAAVSEYTGVSFGRVLCVDPEYAFGRLCLVLGASRRPTLVISANLVEALAPGQLLALLAHEAAHVRYRHIARKVGWAMLLTVVAIAGTIALFLLIDPLFSQRFRLVANLLALAPVMVLRNLYEARVTRRHEAEADGFAVRVAGAGALLTGLEVIQARGPTAAVVHNRWTTHSTWDVRAARIRELQKAAPEPLVTSPR